MIVAGFGFRAQASVASLHDALTRAAAGRSVSLLAAPADKASAACIQGLARRIGLAVVPIDASALSAVSTASHSPQAMAARGTGSVAEAAAMAAAGAEATLLTARVISTDRMATCALAEGGNW